MEDVVHSHSTELQLQCKALQEKLVDTENWLCWNNICVLGIPEWTEGPKPAEFAETFLATLLGLGGSPINAHCGEGTQTTTASSDPRFCSRFLICLLNYQDRNKLMII